MSRFSVGVAHLAGLKKIRSRGPLVAKVHQTLKEAIISGQLPPGAWLSEQPLTKAMGISRTPLREAFNRLVSEGFIAVVPRKGAHVVDLSEEELTELFEAREVIETTFFVRAAEKLSGAELRQMDQEFAQLGAALLAAYDGDPAQVETPRRAYLRIDRAFHDRLILASGNTYWTNVYFNLRDRIELYGFQLSRLPNRFRLAIHEHATIMDALLRGEYDRARTVMQEHIRNVRLGILEYRKQSPAAGG
jgi:DNA-binding GntR family transcriptional regulator